MRWLLSAQCVLVLAAASVMQMPQPSQAQIAQPSNPLEVAKDFVVNVADAFSALNPYVPINAPAFGLAGVAGDQVPAPPGTTAFNRQALEPKQRGVWSFPTALIANPAADPSTGRLIPAQANTNPPASSPPLIPVAMPNGPSGPTPQQQKKLPPVQPLPLQPPVASSPSDVALRTGQLFDAFRLPEGLVNPNAPSWVKDVTASVLNKARDWADSMKSSSDSAQTKAYDLSGQFMKATGLADASFVKNYKQMNALEQSWFGGPDPQHPIQINVEAILKDWMRSKQDSMKELSLDFNKVRSMTSRMTPEQYSRAQEEMKQLNNAEPQQLASRLESILGNKI